MKKLKNFTKKLKLVWQIKKIRLFYTFISFVELSTILFLGWFHNRFIEVLTIVPLFFIFRKLFDKELHAKKLMYCATYSIIVFYFVSSFIFSVNTTMAVCVAVPYVLTFVSYHIRCYLDLLKEKELSTKNNFKNIKELTLEEFKKKFIYKYPINDIMAVYTYIHRNRTQLADNIAMKYNMSKRTLYRLVKKFAD